MGKNSMASSWNGQFHGWGVTYTQTTCYCLVGYYITTVGSVTRCIIFEFLTAAKISSFIFWFVTLYTLVGRCKRFGRTYCLHLQPTHRPTWQCHILFTIYNWFPYLIRRQNHQLVQCGKIT
jgi:hypothetical protein